VSGWSVTTTKACTLQPILIRASNWQFNSDMNQAQDYTIIGASEPMVITAAKSVTFQWSTVFGTNVLNPGSGPYNFGWYDHSGVDCVSAKMSDTGSQYVMVLGSNNPIWGIPYLGNWPQESRIQGNYAIQILSTDMTDPVPPIFSCGNCQANQYYISNTQCGTCPANSASPAGTPSIGGCACVSGTYVTDNNTAAQQCKTCLPGFYCVGGISLPCPANAYCPSGSAAPTQCPALSTSPANSSASTACECGDGYYMSNGVCLICGYGTYGAKGTVGACKTCPANSITTSQGAYLLSQCLCAPGFTGDAMAQVSSVGCMQHLPLEFVLPWKQAQQHDCMPQCHLLCQGFQLPGSVRLPSQR
jgi:hypothetical protein